MPLGPPSTAEREEIRRKEDDDPASFAGVAKRVQVAGGELGIAWTMAYYIVLVAGAVGFYRELWVLTESKTALVGFGGGKGKGT